MNPPGQWVRWVVVPSAIPGQPFGEVGERVRAGGVDFRLQRRADVFDSKEILAAEKIQHAGDESLPQYLVTGGTTFHLLLRLSTFHFPLLHFLRHLLPPLGLGRRDDLPLQLVRDLFVVRKLHVI